MDWQKSPESLIQTFAEALPEAPTVERRKMFGFPAAFAGGNMFAGLHGNDVMVRLPEDARATLLGLTGAHLFEPMAGRPMREYVVLPPAVVADHGVLREWLDRGFQYASAMAPKEKTKPAGKRRT